MNLTLTKVIPEGNQKCPKSKISLFYKSKSPPRKNRLIWAKLSRDGTDSKIPGQSDTQPDENWVRTCFLDRNPNSTFLMKISIFTHNKPIGVFQSKMVLSWIGHYKFFEISVKNLKFISKFRFSDFDRNPNLYS